MGKILSGTSSSSYRHAITRDGFDEYTISWRYDYKPKGCRYRIPRARARDTDRKGAMRFARRWKIDFHFPEKG